MKLTENQHRVLEHIGEVVLKQTRSGKLIPYIDDTNCLQQVNSLAAKGLLDRDKRGKPVRAAGREPPTS